MVAAYEPESEYQNTAKAQTVEAQGVLEIAKALVITTVAQYEFVLENVREIKTRAASVKETRDRATKPLKAALAEIEGWFRPALEALTNAETELKRSIGTYKQIQQAEQMKALSQVQASVQNGDREKTAALIAQATAAEVPKVKGVSTQRVYRFEIADAALIPREYLTPDEKAIGALVRARKGEVQIPGVRVLVDEITKVSTKG